MSKRYIVKEDIKDSLQGLLKKGTMLNYDGRDLYLQDGRKTMALKSVNGNKTVPYFEEELEVEDF